MADREVIGFSITVDSFYDEMTEGQRQHMANKLYKHGYESPKAGHYIAPPWYKQVEEWRDAGLDLSSIAKAYFGIHAYQGAPRGKE